MAVSKFDFLSTLAGEGPGAQTAKNPAMTRTKLSMQKPSRPKPNGGGDVIFPAKSVPRSNDT